MVLPICFDLFTIQFEYGLGSGNGNCEYIGGGLGILGVECGGGRGNVNLSPTVFTSLYIEGINTMSNLLSI